VESELLHGSDEPLKIWGRYIVLQIVQGAISFLNNLGAPWKIFFLND
jgi:hypothetical protein